MGWVLPLTVLLVIVADQLSKLWIRSSLALGQSWFEWGIFGIVRVHNTGAAFGLFQEYPFALIIVNLVTISVLLAGAYFIFRRLPLVDNRLRRVCLGLIIGGALGNLIDRLFFGYVTDFIHIGIWPNFNIADSAVVIGTIILAWSLMPLVRDGTL